MAISVVMIWAATGPFFQFSQTWQIVINTATTIVTFLMVFALQHSQNRNDKALHLKIDELIKAVQGARNEIAGVEEKTEQEIDQLKQTD